MKKHFAVLALLVLTATSLEAAERRRSVRTGPCPATDAQTLAAVNVTQTSFVVTGAATTYGMKASYRFELGASPSSLDMYTDYTPLPAWGVSAVSFMVDGVSPASTFFYRLTVQDGCGTHSGATFSVTTASQQAATLTVSLDASSRTAGHLLMGTTGNVPAVFRMQETTNREDVAITDIVVNDVSSPGAPATYINAVLAGKGVAAFSGSVARNPGGYTYSFHFPSALIVPRNSSATALFSADILPASVLGLAGDNRIHVLTIASVTASGVTSGLKAVIAGSAVSNPQAILQSGLTVAAGGNPGFHPRQPADKIGSIVFSADATGGNVSLNEVPLDFSGSALQSAPPFNVRLMNQSTGADWAAPETCTPQAGKCSVRFTAAPSTVIASGTQIALTPMVDSTGFSVPAGGTSVLTWSLPNADWGDVFFPSGLGLEKSLLPVQGPTITYQ